MRLTLLLLLLSIIGISACNSNETKNQQTSPATSSPASDPATRLNDFYSAYIAEKAKAAEDTGRISGLFREYCTDSFTRHLDRVYAHGELEADPIIDAQDFDQSWIKTLTVQKNGGDGYQVCYVDTYDNQKHCLDVHVVNENGKWKINSVVSSM
ncbi:DUF3828 domain-containing protein [Polluticoccus soli]|uniref:DUF3828 domain-containing protein n=1 Tax=Polluticoccus soli TaxID=3034150 RepID=UPI0023E2648F|nr:DUF3828 domain-containing protein [Flavipsychrobacter sp. JY13-12]